MRLLDNRSGFTLIEVVIAMTIMFIAFAAILSVQSGSISATTRAKQINIVTMLARNKMIETELAIQGKAFLEIPKETNGNFEEPYQEYKWAIQIKDLEFPNMSGTQQGQGQDQQQGGGIADMISNSITSYLSKAMKQIIVTVTWKRGDKEQSTDITMFWVNLNQELTLSGGP